MSPKHIWQKIYRDDYEEYEEKKLPEMKFKEQIDTSNRVINYLEWYFQIVQVSKELFVLMFMFREGVRGRMVNRKI